MSKEQNETRQLRWGSPPLLTREQESYEHKDFMDMIPRYLANELKERELLLFLEHVRSCHTCYEELETAFMVDRTVRYLNDEMDDDEPGSYNLPEMMLRDITQKQAAVQSARRARRILRIIALAAGILAALAGLDILGVLQLTRF